MTKEEFCKALSFVVKEDYDAVLVEKEHQFSPQFEKKIERLIRNERKPLWRYTNTFRKRLALTALLLILCLAGIFTVSVDARKLVFKMLKVPEDPPEIARTEYRYPFSPSDTVERVMEQFLTEYRGPDAQYFVQEGNADWRFIYRDVWTDCAYTAQINGDELRIFDNTGGAKPADIRRRIDNFFKKHSKEENTARQEQRKADFLSSLTGTAERVDILLYYSTQDACFYDLLSYVAVDDSGAYYSDGIMTPIP